MPGAPAGINETGAPSFVVLGPEALGLSSAPIDMHLLPDGRILVVSHNELSFGDGVRWEPFQGAANQPPILGSVAVDTDGRIYTGIDGGMARIDLSEGARWRMTPVIKFPENVDLQNATSVSVVTFPDHWYWYGGGNAIVSWRPGQPMRFTGNVPSFERMFGLGTSVYLSDQSSGEFYRMQADGPLQRVRTENILVSEALTCATPFGPDQLLVGTVSAGLKLFDGKSFHAFAAPGLLATHHRISDLCAVGDGYYAAAVDTVGIVFFDRTGHTVQTLDRSLDHRLARVMRLVYAPEGVLWALLNEGMARVEFPSPVSHFEPLLASGIAFAQPLRHAGELWMHSDGRAMHGQYDASGHLERFEDDTPPGRFLFTLMDAGGRLFAGNELGIYVYADNDLVRGPLLDLLDVDGQMRVQDDHARAGKNKAGWRLILPGIMNARIIPGDSSPHHFYYVARGEYGRIEQNGENYTATRTSLPELGDNYSAVVDAAGIGWFELGVGHVGRLDPNGGQPRLQILGTGEGIYSGWVEVYLLDGIARFHVGNSLFRFDDAAHKFVEDRELLASLPQLGVGGGRPVTDNTGRLWYTSNRAVQVIDRRAEGGNRPVKSAPVGFAPTGYTAQADGVIWMFERLRLARMDPRSPPAPERPLQALITSVDFPSSSHQLFNPGAELQPVSYADNSLVIHFAAPANPFAAPITFEVLLEGAGTPWVSTGIVGSATFNRLKEGDYVFHVRPVAGGTTRGTEARLQFTVRPPWFRTPLAWVLYSLTAAALLIFVTWLSSYLQRRENDRLELLVARRTAELNTTNEQLGRQIAETTEKSAALTTSEERYRLLNSQLEDRVKERTAKLAEASGLLDAMLENTPDLIYFKDRASRFVRFSRAFAARFSLDDSTLIQGKTDFDFFAPAHAQPAFDDEQEIIRTGQPIVGKLEEETYADGHVTWVLTTKMPWRDGTGAIVGTFGISKDVTAWKTAETRLAETHKQLLAASRQAGMAEVATGVLHNVGNVLNSLNVSSTLIATRARQSKADSLARLSALLQEHSADLAGFLTIDPKGRRVPEFIDSLARNLVEERERLLQESESLQKNIDHIKEIVSMQQAYATVVSIVEPQDAATLMDEALHMNLSTLTRHDVRVVRDYQPAPPVLVEKGKVLQILINLIRNAKHACDERHQEDNSARLITVRVAPGATGFVQLAVQDNGVGILAANLTRVFQHGFTTKATGHGFGLHSSANAAREMKGALTARSDGPGTGATFILELPVAVPRPAAAPAATAAAET